MRLAACLLALSFSSLSAQTSATDAGLMIIGASVTQTFGQMCGTVTCTPIPAGTVSPGNTRMVAAYGAPGTPYILAIGLPGPCLPFPGIANSLLLSSPATLSIGTTLQVSTSSCPVAAGRYTLMVPANAPTGFTFRLQALVMSFGQAMPAFTPALELQI
jgi:hypothetical protein